MNKVQDGNKRRKLSKSLKPSWVFAIALGSSVGWGAFILPGDWITQSGPMGAIIGLFIGALVMMIIASSFGVMIQKFQYLAADLHMLLFQQEKFGLTYAAGFYPWDIFQLSL